MTPEQVRKAYECASSMRPQQGHLAVSPVGFQALQAIANEPSTMGGLTYHALLSVFVLIDPQLGDDEIEARPAERLSDVRLHRGEHGLPEITR